MSDLHSNETLDEPVFASRPSPNAVKPVAPGQVYGSYTLLRKLGRGGMGEVFAARQARLNREVALKFLHPHSQRDTTLRARFEREMQVIGQLDHANLVRAHDAVEAEGRLFLVMELLEGIDLEELVRRQGALPIAEACEAVRQAAIGLDQAHQQAIIHRDVKPSNLMLTHDGTVKVLDLGLARSQISNDNLTQSDVLMGTADYLAPEQAESATKVSGAADIYSLGATLFTLLAGRAPYDDGTAQTTFEIVVAHRTKPIPHLRTSRKEVPELLEKIVRKMLSKKPEKRPTAGEVARWLRKFSAGAQLKRLVPKGSTTEHLASRPRKAKKKESATLLAESNDATFAGIDEKPKRRRRRPADAKQRKKTELPVWLLALVVVVPFVTIPALVWALQSSGDEAQSVVSDGSGAANASTKETAGAAASPDSSPTTDSTKRPIVPTVGNKQRPGLRGVGDYPIEVSFRETGRNDWLRLGAQPEPPPGNAELKARLLLPQDAYRYVLFVHGNGDVVPLYPWTEGWQRPTTESPVSGLQSIALPSLVEGREFEPYGAMRTVLLFASDEKLPTSFDVHLQRVLPDLPRQHVPRLSGWFTNSRLVAFANQQTHGIRTQLGSDGSAFPMLYETQKFFSEQCTRAPVRIHAVSFDVKPPDGRGRFRRPGQEHGPPRGGPPPPHDERGRPGSRSRTGPPGENRPDFDQGLPPRPVDEDGPAAPRGPRGKRKRP